MLCYASQGVRTSSPPGKARGFRGQDTVERHGGLNVVMEKIVQREPENPASNGREMIDDFRLRGSRTCRRRGGHLTNGGWCREVAHVVAHDFGNYKSALSEGEALPLVVQVVPGNPQRTRVGTDYPSPMGQSPVRWRHRLSAPRTERRGAAQEGEMVVRATPPFLPLVRHRRRVRGPPLGPPLTPGAGVALTTVIPAGRLKIQIERRCRYHSSGRWPQRPVISLSARQ